MMHFKCGQGKSYEVSADINISYKDDLLPCKIKALFCPVCKVEYIPLHLIKQNEEAIRRIKDEHDKRGLNDIKDI